MKLKSSIWKYSFLFLAFALLVTTNCKKEEEQVVNTEEPAAAPDLSADKLSVNQLEVWTLTCDNFTLTQDTYTATIGGQTVTLCSFDNKLAVVIPEIAPGDYTLETTLEGNSFSRDVTVVALPTISNPDASIQAAVNNFVYTSAYLNTLANATANMFGGSNNSANNLILNNYRIELQNKINSASPQEKLELAKFIAANPLIFSALEDVTQYIDQLNLDKRKSGFTDEEIKNIQEAIALKIIYLGKLTVIGVCLQAYALATPEIITKIIAFAGWVGIAYENFEFGKYLIIIFDKSLHQDGSLFINSSTPNKGSFINETEYTFTITSAYRNLNSQDVGSSYPVISGIENTLSTFENYWNVIMGYLPSKLIGGAFHIKNVATVKSKISLVNPANLTINNISNSNVTCDVDNSGGKLNVTFSTTETTNQHFNFDIVYNNEGVSTNKTTITGSTLTVLEPYSIAKISGDNQTGQLGQQLSSPIRVIVKSQDGTPLPNIKVNCTANNGGSVAQSQVTTASNGTANILWTLGSTATTQTLTVTSFKNDNVTPLQGSPLTFTATKAGCTTFMVGGYEAVQIGTQVWMVKNLNTSTYRNGDPIPNVTGPTSWYDLMDTETGAYCDYDNNPANSAVYGKLYNFYAITDSRNICPVGWHVPTDAEFTTLANYLGGVAVAGGKLKETGTSHWTSPNTGATNTTCFSAIAAGYRNCSVTTTFINKGTYNWLATSSLTPDNIYCIVRGLYNQDSHITDPISSMPNDGNSVRCIKD
jgi:uncharacterized protein (TIGR02145 family)